MESVDIVITYLNDSDPVWTESFNKYKEEEINKGIATLNNKQAFGKDRVRDWDTLKYWFRGVEKNCPWVRKIFFIIQGPNQIPSWLNINNSKLRIVYHDEYVPKELLPTFNSRPIEIYTCKIKDLSNNYIRCNDDCYFLNPIPEDMFFKNGKPVMPENRRPFELFDASGVGAPFWGALNNNMKIEKKYLNGKNYTYGITHLQMPCDKNFELQILNIHNEEIMQGLSVSRFRNSFNYNIFLFDNLERLCENTIINNDIFQDSIYTNLKLDLDYNILKTKQCVCINDTDKADKDYINIKKQLIEFFEELFPNKSSFEK